MQSEQKQAKKFEGRVLFLDRSDINTDEIIPAKYLTEITKEALKPYLLEDLKLEGLNPESDIAEKQVIITRENFGCGSSREHAPWALEVNGINVVIAESYARIFRQNMFNCGMLAIELPQDKIDYIFVNYSKIETFLSVDVEKNEIIIKSGEKSDSFSFSISDYDKALVLSGGWVEFADKNY